MRFGDYAHVRVSIKMGISQRGQRAIPANRVPAALFDNCPLERHARLLAEESLPMKRHFSSAYL
jgi:hypothetical protein